MIIIHHNFDETKFKWLWAKYVKGGNLEKHCTACLKGPYSKKFSGTSNKDLLSQPQLFMDEVDETNFDAIYFCGVLKHGYPKTNYPHNVHFAILPKEGASDVWDFENWHVEISGGVLSPMPTEDELSPTLKTGIYNEHYYTCRIFRWMVGFYYPNLIIR